MSNIDDELDVFPLAQAELAPAADAGGAAAAAAAHGGGGGGGAAAGGGAAGVVAPGPPGVAVPDPAVMSQVLDVLRKQQESSAALVARIDEQERRHVLREKEAQVAAAKSQVDMMLNQLGKPQNKEIARYLTAVSECNDAKDRATLTAAAVNVMRLLEVDATDVEEPLQVLTTAVKAMKSVSDEERTALVNRLKVTKRKATACTRCAREGHTADACFAGTTKGGEPLASSSSKRQRGQTAAAAGTVMATTAGYGLHFPGLALPGGVVQQPQVQQVQQLVPLQANGQPIVCYTCHQPGHKSFQCSVSRQQQVPAAAAAASAKKVSMEVERVEPVQVGSSDVKADELTVLRECDAVCDAVGDAVFRPTDPDNSASASAMSTEENSPQLPVCIEDEDSLAAAYADCASGWQVEDQGSGDESEGEELDTRCAASATDTRKSKAGSKPAELYIACHESNQTSVSNRSNPLAMLDVVPVLAQRAETDRSLAELEREGEAIMPARTRSLKGAIAAEFAGKKKVLSEEEVLRQKCVRCSKTGHTELSCPDQTQKAEADKNASDAWVRRLIGLPRVDIAKENKNLSLAEGVKRWLARGEEFNRGNPWANSDKMEDSLKKRLGYHKALGMSSVHLGWIGFGVPLHFVGGKSPRPLAFRNHASAMEEEEFVDAEHAANVADGSYVEVKRESLRGICPLQVVRHPVTQKRRLVQDLRWINGHVPNVKFRMESLHQELGDVVQPGDKMFTSDIAKAYYCLAMHLDAQRYLGWEWKGKFYMPTCLVFGLAPAPRIFTKIMRPMMAFFRSLGVRVLGMIDDYLWADRPEKIEGLRAAVQTVLPALGWRFNAKCEWEPADEVLMLGMLVNALKFQVRAPPKKIAATRANIAHILAKQRAVPQRPVTIKELQQVTGRLMSMMLALPGVRVFTRSLYQVLALALEGNEGRKLVRQPLVWTVQLTARALEELEFWQTRLLSHNGLRINCRENQVQVLLWSDASDVGWGGEAAGVEANVPATEVPRTPVKAMAYGALPFVEIQRSSTRRELVALLKVASTPKILAQIRGQRIRVIMDSVPALCNLIKGGGPVPELCDAVRDWVKFCEQHGIEAEYEWVERAANWRADEASKLHSQQHTLRSLKIEAALREKFDALPATQWRKRTNHFVYGKVGVFYPMFHQVDARVEMIRSQLEEAIIVVPRWPAGGTHDWWRRVVTHSIASVSMGKVGAIYAERPQTGHDDELEAFWLMGRRGEKKRAEWLQRGGQ